MVHKSPDVDSSPCPPPEGEGGESEVKNIKSGVQVTNLNPRKAFWKTLIKTRFYRLRNANFSSQDSDINVALHAPLALV